MIAEKVSGIGLAELFRAELLIPNSLAHTFLDGAEPVSGSLAPGYLVSGGDATYAVHPSRSWAAGAMVATAADALEWIARLGSGQVHEPTTQSELESPTATSTPGVSYGLGVFLLSASFTGGAGPGIGHLGDIFGYHTQAFHFPEADLTIVSIVNRDGAKPNDITVAALAALLP
jgi:D-alanyl-D-alanine carboxypeptidase